MVAVVPILKPLLYVWLGLKALDDVSLLMRITRLVAVLIPGQDEDDDNNMCDLCDDVMGDVLAQEGISVLPCRLLCLHIPKCVDMCHKLQDMSSTSTKYPCVTLGYCSATEEHFAIADVQCEVGRFFSCTPRKYCRRVRTNLFRYSCELKPGLGRWVGLQNSLADHANALASGILKQPHCGEPGAGKYCIARPHGLGAVCEVIGSILSIIYGGYQSILAIESPGGDDDTQWLTFWLVQGGVLSVERFFMRPILSNFRMYYELKLCLLIWLMWFNGSERAYRRFRRFLITHTNLIQSAHQKAHKDLEVLKATGKALVQKRLNEIHDEIISEREIEMSTRSLLLAPQDWEPDYGDDDSCQDETVVENASTPPRSNSSRGSIGNSSQLLEEPTISSMDRLGKYLLSPEGGRELMSSPHLSRQDKQKLVDWAHAQIQFEPKYLYINLIGTIKGPQGILPVMDSNGLADPYVICRLIHQKNGKAKNQRMMSSFKDNSPISPGTTSQSNERRQSSIRTQGRTRRSIRSRRATRHWIQWARAQLDKFWQVLSGRCKIVKSRILYDTRRPQWNQTLELPLSYGYIDSTGTYHNDSIKDTALCLEVWDADIEFWGYVLRFSPIIITIMSIYSLFAYVTALSDHLTTQQNAIIKGIYLSVFLTLFTAYIMADVKHADDDPIGYCTVPLEILMDKAEHSLRLTLKELPPNQLKISNSLAQQLHRMGFSDLSEDREGDHTDDNSDGSSLSSNGDEAPTNEVGGYGVLRVKLMLAET